MALRAANYVLSGTTFLEHGSHCVYAWKRGSDFLYVGYTKRGLGRVFQHNLINVTEPVLETDSIEIWNGFETAAEAKLFEQQLIVESAPEYNRDWKSEHGKRTICWGCGNTFTPKREWQKYCSDTCRNKRTPERTARILIERACENCGEKFKTYSPIKRFCCGKCGWQYWDKTHPRGKITTNELSNSSGNPVSG